MSVATETLAKADPELRRALAGAAPGAVLPVIATLAPDAPLSPAPPDRRAQWAADQEAAFAAETADLARELQSYRARDLVWLWIARSVSGELPLAAIDALARRPEVIRLALVVPRNVLL